MAGKGLTKEEYIEKYGEDAWEIRRRKYVTTLESCIAKYGLEEGTVRYNAKLKRDKTKGTLHGYIERYGEVEGPIKYKEKNSRLSISEKSLKLNGFSDDEISTIRKAHSDKSGMNLENFISRYGEIDGRIKHSDWLSKNKDRSVWTIQFWTKRGFTETEAKDIIKERQANSTLEKFMFRYGVEEGTLKYLDVNKRKTRNFFGNTVSRLERAFFDNLSKLTYINEKGRSCKLRFPERNVICDYLDASKNRIIEINGDFWHMNPNLFEAYDINKVTNRSAKEIWETEENRNKILKDKGYKILVIWETELNSNYDGCLELAKNFLEK